MTKIDIFHNTIWVLWHGLGPILYVVDLKFQEIYSWHLLPLKTHAKMSQRQSREQKAGLRGQLYYLPCQYRLHQPRYSFSSIRYFFPSIMWLSIYIAYSILQNIANFQLISLKWFTHFMYLEQQQKNTQQGNRCLKLPWEEYICQNVGMSYALYSFIHSFIFPAWFWVSTCNLW